MTKNDKIIYTLIGIIIVCSILLFIVDSNTPYDIAVYNQAYNEYEKINDVASNNINDNISAGQETNDGTTQPVIAEQNNFTNQNVITYEPIRAQTPTYATIGVINIPKINISYPVLKDYKEEYLNIAPIKLAGPEANRVGNLVIVAHNNLNQQFFSNLHKLNKNDIVKLTDTSGNTLTYKVYSKYEIPENDLSVLSQNTGNQIELTLITCVKYRFDKRLIVKCVAV